MQNTNDGTHDYLYDQLYHLIEATHPQPQNPAESFDYDPVGNRLTSTDYNDWSYDVNNRLMGYDGVTYSYDANGNLTSKTDVAGTTTYQYDSENRLIQVVTPASLINYQYDGLGRRIIKTANGIMTKYVYDDKDVLLELDGNEQIKTRYTRTLAIDELISVDRDTTGDGVLDSTNYYHKDALGSVIAMTDSLGNVVQTYVYDAFGNIKSSSGSVENRYTYTRREWDSEAGLYYYRARYYSAEIGRFLSEDPKGFDAGINFYVYVENNPINFTDSSGLCEKCEEYIDWECVAGCIALVLPAAIVATCEWCLKIPPSKGPIICAACVAAVTAGVTYTCIQICKKCK